VPHHLKIELNKHAKADAVIKADGEEVTKTVDAILKEKKKAGAAITALAKARESAKQQAKEYAVQKAKFLAAQKKADKMAKYAQVESKKSFLQQAVRQRIQKIKDREKSVLASTWNDALGPIREEAEPAVSPAEEDAALRMSQTLKDNMVKLNTLQKEDDKNSKQLLIEQRSAEQALNKLVSVKKVITSDSSPY
jgi:hypothetical protein